MFIYIDYELCIIFSLIIRAINKSLQINRRQLSKIKTMKYRNFQIYVQRQIDKLLYDYKHFVKTYVDDVIMFFQSLKKHFRHLNQIFDLFAKMNVMFKSFKIYFEYFSMFLLNQKIDNFDFSIAEKKLKIILNINFLQLFKHLESYLKNEIFKTIHFLLCTKDK